MPGTRDELLGRDRGWPCQLLTDEELCAELDAEDDARKAVLACMDDTSIVFDYNPTLDMYAEEGQR